MNHTLTYHSVLTGIDVLARDNFAALNGARVGLVTNHTGLTGDGRTTIDALHAAPGVTLAALFGPEHGLRGEHDEAVADGVDTQTGLPVFSLFGTRTQPTPEQLAGLDTLVFDIQDIGCRFYTYLSTLLSILEAASAHDLHVVVLDRPNPIGGEAAEGPLADRDALSFVACHPVPVRHGLTLGEMARLLHAERGLTCSLEVIACDGWRREDWYDATGLLWTHPSPNMRRLTAAALYPGVGRRSLHPSPPLRRRAERREPARRPRHANLLHPLGQRLRRGTLRRRAALRHGPRRLECCRRRPHPRLQPARPLPE